MKRFLVPTTSSSCCKRARASATTPSGVPQSRRISTHDDLDVLYFPKFVDDPLDAYNALIDELSLTQTSIQMFGRAVKEPRLTGYFGSKPYKYAGSLRHPDPYTSLLRDIKEKIESLSDVRGVLGVGTDDAQGDDDRHRHTFNGCLANLYRDGSDHMGLHRDAEKEIGPTADNRVIASVSLGAPRRFVFKRDSDGAKVELILETGSLLLMKGRTQSLWKHGIPKTAKPTGQRLNLTFRVIV